jgi:hypothetical protein
MGIRNFPLISIGVEQGVTTAAIAAPGNIAIPTMTNGDSPKFLALTVVDGVAGDWIVVSPQVAATNGVLATGFAMNAISGNTIILNVHGFSHIGFEDGAGVVCQLNLYPLEDF